VSDAYDVSEGRAECLERVREIIEEDRAILDVLW